MDMTTRTPFHERVSVPYQLFMLALCAWALVVLGIASFFSLDPAIQTILDYADTVVCVLFLVDFVYNLARAPNRLHYFLTWGWVDLVSSIPTVGAFRWGRAARVMRSHGSSDPTGTGFLMVM